MSNYYKWSAKITKEDRVPDENLKDFKKIFKAVTPKTHFGVTCCIKSLIDYHNLICSFNYEDNKIEVSEEYTNLRNWWLDYFCKIGFSLRKTHKIIKFLQKYSNYFEKT